MNIAKTDSTEAERAKKTYRYMSIGTSADCPRTNHAPSPAPDDHVPLEVFVPVRLAASPAFTSPLPTAGVVAMASFCLRAFFVTSASRRSPLSRSSSSLVSVVPTSRSVDENENSESFRPAPDPTPVYDGIRHVRFFGAFASLPVPPPPSRRLFRSSCIRRCLSNRRRVFTCAVTCSAKKQSATNDIMNPTAPYSSTMIGCESTTSPGASCCALYACSGVTSSPPSPWSPRAPCPFVSTAATSCRPTRWK